MRPLYIGGIGLLAILIIVIIYFTLKTTPAGKCTATTTCADTWYGSDGKVVPAQQLCDLSTLQVAKPNVGPGQCASPCKGIGETAFYSVAAKAGHCVPAGTPPGCWGDADCGTGKCANIDSKTGMGTCACSAPYIGDHCEFKGCTDAKACSGHGKCVNGACSCDDGWDGPTCNRCKPGRGPPGDCRYQRYTYGAGAGPFPVPLTPTQTSTCIDNNNTTGYPYSKRDGWCKAAYGPAAIYPPQWGIEPTEQWWCSSNNNNNACYSEGCSYGWNTNQILCGLPNGFWAPPGKNYGAYRACNTTGYNGGCQALLPDGFAGAVQEPTPDSSGAALLARRPDDYAEATQ